MFSQHVNHELTAPLRAAVSRAKRGKANPRQWFALCDREATGTTAHPILGAVPTCDRCFAFASGGKR